MHRDAGYLIAPTRALDSFVQQSHSGALVVDFDGTLAPIVDHPEDAVALPESLDALRALTPHLGLVAIISGRPVDFLRDRVAVDGLSLVGQYGLERLVRGEAVFDPRAEPYVGPVAEAAAEAAERWPRLVIERKGSTAVALHWRTVPDAAPPDAEVGELAARHGLAVLPGRMVVELRPPVTIDKGTALESLLGAAAAVRHAAFAGDDVGDLAAYDALDRLLANGGLDGAVRIAVRSEESPPDLLDRADIVVDGPRGLATLLTDTVDRLEP